MSGTRKFLLIGGGFVSALLLVTQLVMGLLIAGGRVNLIKAHQHSGYTAVGLSIVYIAASLVAIASIPSRDKA